MSSGNRRLFAAVAALAVAALAPRAGAQGTVTVTGRVVEAGSQATPIPDVRVIAVGTNAVSVTNSDGRYVLRVAPGPQTLRALRIGYVEQKRTLTVAPNTTADFAMTPSLVQLTEVVTTATGTQRRVELGNSVQTLGDVSKRVETQPVTNLQDLMVAKAPGVTVLPGNMIGSSPNVRIRGLKSLSLNSEPIYVIDGVRMNSAAFNIGTASTGNGTSASYLNILNPEEIADVEIVKGPSAATLYGTDAANGVIVITTKKGVAGPARWTMHVGGGSIKDRNNYPTQYALWGHTPAAPTTPARCFTVTVASGACVPDSVTSYNLLADPAVSPIATGYSRQWGGQVTGGTEAVRYFVSGDFQGDVGPLKMPEASQRFLDSTGNAMRDELLRPEYFGRNSLRANLSAALTPKLDVSVNTGYTRSNQRLPQTDNNTWGHLFQAYGNPGFKPTVACMTTPVSCLGYTNKGLLGEELGGYAQYLPANTFQNLSQLNVDRFISSANAQWRPLSWLLTDATVGMDQANRDNVQMCRFGECPVSTSRQGYVYDLRAVDRNISSKLTGTATWQARSSINLKTTLGADYTNKQYEYASAEGDVLPPGTVVPQAGATQFANGSFLQADKTLGYYAQEQVALRDLLFVTVAVRRDQNSAFGTKFQNVNYPKASVSYVVSDESWFPKQNWVTQLRLRGAYGASGVQPGSTTALQTYQSAKVNVGATPAAVSGTDTPGLIGDALGNPDLKPERSTEREFGFETRFLDRMNLDVTYYNNLTKDALVNQPIAPSAGPSALTVTRNIGSVRNTGIEASLTTALLDLRDVAWNVTIGGSHNTNKVESLGEQPCVVNTTDCLTGTKPNNTIGTGANRDSLNMPLRGLYARLYTYNDANNDGIISANEITVDKNFSFVGYAVPRDIVTIQNSIDLFQRRLSLNLSFDYKGGFSINNSGERFLCSAKDTCHDLAQAAPGSANPVLNAAGGASLDRQARAVASRLLGTNNTNAGYYENGQFWRFRELGATASLPQAWASKLRVGDASLTFAARNLHTWTKYSGTDPEANYATFVKTTAGVVSDLGNVQTDLLTTAPPTYYTVRLNLHY